MDRADVVIVGAGHAGAQSAIALRQNGFEGSICLIGREPEYPYERPPLSKEYLAGEKSFDRIMIRPSQFWEDRAVTVMLGREVVEVDPDAQRVRFADRNTLEFGRLVWAAGGDARRLSCPGAGLAGIHVMRTRQDADSLDRDLDRGVSRVVIVGGGYIGLEAAAVLRKRGCDVTVVEAQDRLLSRVAGAELSDFFLAEHLRQGVSFLLSSTVDAIEGDKGRVTGVRLGDGSALEADALIVGIGIVPSVGPLLAAGARGEHEVEVDEFCRTSLDDIYAIGDCALHANAFADGRLVRLESVQNANDMATTAALDICGAPKPYDTVPWFWSNQYDLKLQTVGISQGHDEAVLRGAPQSRSFSIVYLKNGKVIALDCVNAVKDYVQGRKLVEHETKVDPETLRDTDIPLKSLVV